MKYILIERPINIIRNIVAVTIDVHDNINIYNHLCLLNLVSNKHYSNESLIELLHSFIRNIINIDFVMNFICAFNMTKFDKKFQNYDLTQKQIQR